MEEVPLPADLALLSSSDGNRSCKNDKIRQIFFGKILHFFLFLIYLKNEEAWGGSMFYEYYAMCTT